jgi:transposase
MRKRKRELTHQPVVYKYRAYLNATRGRLPDAVYSFAKRHQETWNALAVEQDRRWKEWQITNPPTTIDGKIVFKKPPKEWWSEWDGWMRQRVEQAHLGWEAAGDIVDRFSNVLRKTTQGHGAPRIQKGLTSFSIPHRYTGGGVLPESLGSIRAKRFRVNFPPSSTYWTNHRHRRRARVAKAQFLVGETSINMNLVVHREIPGDAIIKSVRLVGCKQSPTVEWQIHIAITAEIPRVQPATINKVVGIDVGWRTKDGKLRVAVGYDGTKHFELCISPEFMHNSLGCVSIDRQRCCQQLCDAAVEQCKAKLIAVGVIVPPQARSGFLMRMLKDANVPADIVQLLQAWKRENDTLRRKAILLSNAMIGRRNHRYREWAAELAAKYDLVRVEALNLPQMYSLGTTKQAQQAGQYALWMSREWRNLASVGVLISAIENAARMRGKGFERVESAGSTILCSKCFGAFEVEGNKLEGKCARCGRIVDQDWNAAENIFANIPASLQPGRVAEGSIAIEPATV